MIDNFSADPVFVSWGYGELQHFLSLLKTNPPLYPSRQMEILWIIDTESGVLDEKPLKCEMSKNMPQNDRESYAT